MVVVAQLVRASVCGTEGRGFEPHLPPILKLSFDSFFCFMSYYVYILYSKVLDKYYIGQTNDVGKRLERHNKGYEKFTSRGIPWELKGFKEFETRKEAIKEEKRIKNFKSRKRIEEWLRVVGAEK